MVEMKNSIVILFGETSVGEQYIFKHFTYPFSQIVYFNTIRNQWKSIDNIFCYDENGKLQNSFIRVHDGKTHFDAEKDVITLFPKGEFLDIQYQVHGVSKYIASEEMEEMEEKPKIIIRKIVIQKNNELEEFRNSKFGPKKNKTIEEFLEFAPLCVYKDNFYSVIGMLERIRLVIFPMKSNSNNKKKNMWEIKKIKMENSIRQKFANLYNEMLNGTYHSSPFWKYHDMSCDILKIVTPFSKGIIGFNDTLYCFSPKGRCFMGKIYLGKSNQSIFQENLMYKVSENQKLCDLIIKTEF